jgi:hypothetical protein
MSKARDIANILSANTAIATDAEVTSSVSAAVSTHATAANGHTGRGTTENRPASPTLGDLYFDTTLNALIAYRTAGWEKVSQDPAPQIASISPTAAATTGTVVTITGSNFKSGLAVQFIGTNAVSYNSPTSTFVNGVTATATTPSLPVAYEPYDIKVINPDNQFAILENCLDGGSTPVWVTPSGTLATISEQSSLNTSVAANDPDGTSIVYSSSNLPGWITLNSSTGSLTGTSPDISSNTNYSFDIIASDGVNTSTRSFNVVVNVITVPNTIELLLIAGGGSGGGNAGGGGGAGGVVYNSALSVTPSTQYSISIGNGGTYVNGRGPGNQGSNSSFGGVTATGGGGGGSADGGPSSGGSGGGRWGVSQSGGTGIAGQGYDGGTGFTGGGYSENAGGGGGAGGAGGNANSTTGGAGGVGTNSYSSWATATSSGVNGYFASGGGAGTPGNGTSVNPGTATNGGGAGGTRSSAASNGTANTGSGGGGGSYSGSPGTYYNSGNGGSGICIIRYLDTYADPSSYPGGTKYTSGGYKYFKFTGSGSVTF